MSESSFDLRGDLPPGLLAVSARDLHRLLPRPTLSELPGRRARPLFVSILLRGNEDSGLRAIQQVFARLAAPAGASATTVSIGEAVR